jgi:hypothetical protein
VTIDTRGDDTCVHFPGPFGKVRRSRAEHQPVVSSILKLGSMLCIAAIVVSFAAFASDEAGEGKDETVARLAHVDATAAAAAKDAKELNQPSPPPRVERVREKQHAGWREAVDDVNDVVTGPFTTVAGDATLWVQRIVTGLLALAVFGFGLSFASRMVALRGF